MSISAKLSALVKNLDHGALEALRRSVAAEIKGRAGRPSMQDDAGHDARNIGSIQGDADYLDSIQSDAIHIDSIRPGMSAPDKEKAAKQIARVLRGGD